MDESVGGKLCASKFPWDLIKDMMTIGPFKYSRSVLSKVKADYVHRLNVLLGTSVARVIICAQRPAVVMLVRE